MYEKVPTTIKAEALAFDLPQFIERYETLIKAIIEDTLIVKEKSKELQ
jgi:hypothetical protein